MIEALKQPRVAGLTAIRLKAMKPYSTPSRATRVGGCGKARRGLLGQPHPTVSSEIQGREIQAARPLPDRLSRRHECRPVARPLRAAHQRRTPLGCRPEIEFKGKSARVLLDQLRSVNKQRLGGKMGKIDLALWHPVLLEMLAF